MDTYFPVPGGRLKLRHGIIENALIHYQREDQAGPKESTVTRYDVRTEPAVLRDVLEAALGVLVVVDKRRHILWANGNTCKFHVDEVSGLGSFVEIEAIDRTGDICRDGLRDRCEHYMRELGIEPVHLESRSYSDLLMARG